MKRCPECRRDYSDDTLLYCLEDGTALVQGSVAAPDEPQTAMLPSSGAPGGSGMRAQIHTTEQTAILPTEGLDTSKGKGIDKRLIFAPLALAVIVLSGFFGYRYFKPVSTDQINSIAVM